MNINNEEKIEFPLFEVGKFSIAESHHDELMQIIKDMLPGIKNWMEFTLEDLIGNYYWLTKTMGERRTLGRYFAYLVYKGLLPFEFAYSRCGAPKRYRLK